jgi:hypothetical protein
MVGNGVLVHGRYGGGHHNGDDNNKNENERVVVVVARAPESVNSGRWREWRLPFRGVMGSVLFWGTLGNCMGMYLYTQLCSIRQ